LKTKQSKTRYIQLDIASGKYPQIFIAISRNIPGDIAHASDQLATEKACRRDISAAGRDNLNIARRAPRGDETPIFDIPAPHA
jgi:hypothetical protein